MTPHRTALRDGAAPLLPALSVLFTLCASLPTPSPPFRRSVFLFTPAASVSASSVASRSPIGGSDLSSAHDELSFSAGFLGSLVYIRMLGSSVDSMADGANGLMKGAIGQSRLLVPVVLVIINNRWNGILVPEIRNNGLGVDNNVSRILYL